ncbi:MAG TPA: FlgD immunoglobulin-like domain containing protein [Treponemataceae bacterium]|nr:FlgD immunoglobulin-like domain containing protein [Treponemataceae bacterium]
MKHGLPIISGLILLTCSAAALFAYDPPAGGDSTNAFLSADALGGNTSAAGSALGGALPGELATNPAIGAREQRITLDASYAALYGTGDDKNGLGHIINFGALYPTRWAVLGGSFNFITSPFDSVPLDTSAAFRVSASKDLTDKLDAGVGLTASTGTSWGLSGEIGALYHLGTLGFLQDSRIGASVTGLGRTFTPDSIGVKGDDATGYASAFTPHIGLAATLFKADGFKLGANTDVSVPNFQNFVLDAGVAALIKDVVTVKTGWTYNATESANDAQTYLPSLGVGVNLKLDAKDKNSFLARNGWAQSEVTPTFAVKPLNNDVYATGGGVNIKLGVTDTKAPAIAIDYPATVWFSPNNDGVKDDLSFGVKITDQRYVTAWSFVVEDSTGAVVRTIANKEVRPEMQNLKSLWKILTKPKAGIALPENIRWDGTTDSGSVAPDGEYRFYMTASDDNGNQATSERYAVNLDNTQPSITATAPTGANAMIFSPDGDGNKDTFRVAQTGSAEDLWKATVLDGSGAAVRTVETKAAAPADFVWDGKTDSNAVAPDGVYSYRIAATDRAGNSNSAKIDNIIVDTEKPAINVTIDTAAFSPNGDGVLDAVNLAPSVPVVTGLLGWDLSIVSRSGTAVRSFAGSSAPSPMAFDGKDDGGKRVAEGDYQAVLSARYANGYAPVARSPFFTLDVTAPEAQARASGKIFSPVGDGKLDTVTYTQTASAETAWTGSIYALGKDGKATGAAVRTFALGGNPESTLVWDGRDDSGKLAPDGRYGYRLQATDRAGNTGYSNIAEVELNTEKADLILQANYAAFSPNGDGVKDSITFTPIVKAATAVDRYALVIKNKDGKAVKTISGTGKVPQSLSWNGIEDPAAGSATGERADDGTYSAALEVTLVNQQSSRSQAPDFELDTKYPTIELTAPYLVFSPNGDGKRDTLPIAQKSSTEDLWTAEIASDKKATVKTFRWNGAAADLAWDATDDSGNRVADGSYAYAITSEDRAGNKTTERIAGIKVDAKTPKAYLTAELPAFSPNGDGVKDTERLSITTNVTEGLESWSLRIRPEQTDGKAKDAVRAWDSATAGNLPAAVNWDGKTDAGTIAQGRFVAELTLSYAKGDVVTASTPAFLANSRAPALGVKLSPKYFSPDNDGTDDELFIKLSAESDSAFTDWSFEIHEPDGTNGAVFWKAGGKGTIAKEIIWDGRSQKGELVQAATDYPFTFTVTDEVGMTSVVRGYIPVDVLIIRDGDRLKIAVPSIIFRENAADFNGLDPAVVDKNTQVLKRIAEILNKFRDYKIEVEGHANNVTGTQKEEDTELIPLSQLRANAVRDFLIKNGVDGSRLTTVGMGGTKPVTARADRENWWKNRRVEFILIK